MARLEIRQSIEKGNARGLDHLPARPGGISRTARPVHKRIATGALGAGVLASGPGRSIAHIQCAHLIPSALG